MFSKYGKNLNIKFLKSTITFASNKRQLFTNHNSLPIKNKTKKKKKRLVEVKSKI